MAHTLYHRIHEDLTTHTPGVAEDGTINNPLLEAYDTLPRVRSIIDACPYNSRADVINRRVTADVLEQVLRLLWEDLK